MGISKQQLKEMGLIEVNGLYVKASSQVDPKPVKIEPGTMLMSLAGKPYYRENEIWTKDGKSEQTLDFVTSVEEPKSNKKIRNATKTIQDGIKFDSRLELYLYNSLQAAGINFKFQKPFVLQDSFKYRGETVRQLKVIFDFWLPDLNYLLDSKGFQLYDGKIKHKLLKYRLAKYYQHRNMGEPPVIVMPKNQKEVNELILKLKSL